MSFLLEFLKHPTKIGAIAPSSHFLAHSMLRTVDFRNISCIVEYGPGTGSFTRHILKRKTKSCKLILIEQNLEFCRQLCNRYKGRKDIRIIHGDVRKIKSYLQEGQKVDVIVSGLPFASFPKELSNEILRNTTHVLKEDGKFITFQYSLLKKKLFERFFVLRERRRVYLNFPPAHVLELRVR